MKKKYKNRKTEKWDEQSPRASKTSLCPSITQLITSKLYCSILLPTLPKYHPAHQLKTIPNYCILRYQPYQNITQLISSKLCQTIVYCVTNLTSLSVQNYTKLLCIRHQLFHEENYFLHHIVHHGGSWWILVYHAAHYIKTVMWTVLNNEQWLNNTWCVSLHIKGGFF